MIHQYEETDYFPADGVGAGVQLLPTAAFAADHADQVRVIVENTTYTAADAPWTGTLVDKWWI